jgi:hypothetical protein
MADLELETADNTANRTTVLIATPGVDPTSDDFIGPNIFEVRPGTTLGNHPMGSHGGIFGEGIGIGVGVHGRSGRTGVLGQGLIGVLGEGATNGTGVVGTGGIIGVRGAGKRCR